jgi:hypothetical protein
VAAHRDPLQGVLWCAIGRDLCYDVL